MMATMRLVVNGERMELDANELDVATLLSRMGLGSQPCAVEVNRTVVPKARHAEHALHDDDHVEIVTLVGGG
jgi:sulfur carrier protein